MAKTKQTQESTIDKQKIAQLADAIGYFDKDSSGPLGMEERLRVASYNMYLIKEIVKELIKE